MREGSGSHHPAVASGQGWRISHMLSSWCCWHGARDKNPLPWGNDRNCGLNGCVKKDCSPFFCFFLMEEKQAGNMSRNQLGLIKANAKLGACAWITRTPAHPAAAQHQSSSTAPFSPPPPPPPAEFLKLPWVSCLYTELFLSQRSGSQLWAAVAS